MPRSTKVNTFSRAPGTFRSRKHVSEITASQVKADCFIVANRAAAQTCHWSSRSSAPTSGPVSRMASITTVAGQRFLGPAALDGTQQIPHRLGEAHRLGVHRLKNKTVALAV